MEKLQGGLMVVAGYTGMQRSNDEEAHFLQEGTFWYLTGVEFPDWWLIMDARRGKSWLVEPEIDEQLRLFTESLAIQDAAETSGIHEVLSRNQAMSMLRVAAKTHRLVYTIGPPPYVDHFGFTLNPAPKNLHDILVRTFADVRDFRPDIAKVRAIKQPIEIKWMQAAIDLTAEALTMVHQTITSYQYEYEIEAELSYAFRRTGGSGHAFIPIIASGGSATVVHYFSNNARIKRNSLVMLDVGARVNGYAADITRTYAHGAPSKRMIQLHALVQAAQRDIIALIKPGLAVEEYHKQSDMIVKRYMLDSKLIASLQDDQAYRRRMPHAISHGLGIDVHDSLGRPKVFEPGMVLTVEPGVYLPEEQIGVRIEDDILITETGHKNLSAKLSTDL